MIPQISDDQIIQLALDYSVEAIHAVKHDDEYLRDCCYYAFGYTFLRSFGFNHNDARDKFISASSIDGRYDNNLPLSDEEIISVSSRFISRYQNIGRYQLQSRYENSRDLIFWTIYYLRFKSTGLNQELSLQRMENGMIKEAGLPDAYPTPPKPPTELLKIGGRLFRTASGLIHTVKEVTAFNLIDIYSKDQGKVDAFLEAFPKANTLRAFWYTSWKDNGWDLPSVDTLLKFHEYVSNKGYYVENSCITDNDASKVPTIKQLIRELNNSGLSNAMLESVNEPYINDKLEPSVIKNDLTNSPYPYTSGIYDDAYMDKFYGRYVVTHTRRDVAQGPRGAKDLEELASKYKMPAVGNEPFRPDQGFSALDFYTYAALSNLMGNGSCFHYLEGELGNAPTGHASECADMFFKGFDVYPDDASLGGYDHLRDMEKPDAQGNPTAALRVFRKGQYAIVVRNKSVDIPSNWAPLDEYQVTYKIG